MKTFALLCVVGLVAAKEAFSGRIAIYGELTLQSPAVKRCDFLTGTIHSRSRVVVL
jgi:hypothetical protein